MPELHREPAALRVHGVGNPAPAADLVGSENPGRIPIALTFRRNLCRFGDDQTGACPLFVVGGHHGGRYLACAGPVYACSFILTNLDVSSPAKTVAAEHWYRHRTTVENLFRDSKLGAALRHLPSGYPQVNTAWMWGALLAATMAAWLHQLTARTAGEDIVHGHGVRGGKAMIATLRWRLIAVPGRLIRHARHLVLRLPPGHGLLPEVLARLRDLPAPA